MTNSYAVRRTAEHNNLHSYPLSVLTSSLSKHVRTHQPHIQGIACGLYGSLSLTQGAYRQFFRNVTSQLSLWYKDHSTPSPLQVGPDQTITRTVVGDKFRAEVVEEAGSLERWAWEVENQKKLRCHWHQAYPHIQSFC